MASEIQKTIAGFPLRDLTEREWILFKVHLAGLPVHGDDKRMALQEAADFHNRRLSQRDYIETGILKIPPAPPVEGP